MMTQRSFLLLGVLSLATVGAARERMGVPPPGLSGQGAQGQAGMAKAAPCASATAKDELDLNNVRARIETGGNMWQNRDGSGGPAYEVPKTPTRNGANSLFAGSLWMGGVDNGQNLKLAAVTFRQQGNDFWPGPLSNNLSATPAETNSTICAAYDRTWKTLRSDAAKQDAYFRCILDPDCDTETEFPDGWVTPAVFFEWPAIGDVSAGQDFYLAPFEEVGPPDGDYNPENGDYPGYDLNGVIDCKTRQVTDPVPLFGDQNIWWVFNDKGNIHTESGGQPIGMEIRAQAFAFSTNDEVNNMTFYNYVLINQGNLKLTDTYFGQWVDPDIGYGGDDYVGCDVQRGLGYAYNGNTVDNGGSYPTYGGPTPPPPAIGVDFFEGPYQDADGQDNPLTTDCNVAVLDSGIVYKGIGIGYGDTFPDNERFGMRAFLYHSNPGQPGAGPAPTQDPDNAPDYYNYLRAIWKDNTPMTYGGIGYTSNPNAVRSYYMFPGDSDPLGWATGCVAQASWTQANAGNPPGDRRFIQSAGPFTLESGAYNNITVGVVWARAGGGDPFASVEAVRRADDKAQSLFDNCFRILDGPDAPDVTIQELDRELILYVSNKRGVSNNYANRGPSNYRDENYIELDPSIPEFDEAGQPNDRFYRFQGYQIFQLKDATVGPDQLNDVNFARLVAQCDIHDTISQLVNWIQDPDINLPVPTQMVVGSDTGVVHSFRIKEDKFALGSTALVNFKTYYYMAIAYGHNNYAEYNPLTLTGQAFPYIPSRKGSAGSIRSYSGIPHKPSVEAGGTVQNAQYGDGFSITRLEGQGNGGLRLELAPETENAIVAQSPWRANEIKYKSGLGPINVKVIDPLKVPAAQFELWIKDTIPPFVNPTSFGSYNRLNDAYWMLVRLSNNPTSEDTVYSIRNLGTPYEQLILDWGISVSVTQTAYSGDLGFFTKFLGSTKEVQGTDWYAGIPDAEGETMQNWIRSGAAKDTTLDYPDFLGKDVNQEYEKVLGGTWAPWPMVGEAALQPCSNADKGFRNQVDISQVPSIQVVFTQDKSKWSRCIVVEESNVPANTTPANVSKLSLRPVPSVDKNGIPSGSPGCNEAEATLVSNTGMGWFPGYAIDLETGERLNVFFGENSFLGGGIGRDMVWNPSDVLNAFDATGTPQPVFGGCHWIYVCFDRRRTGTSENAMPQYDECAFVRDKISSPASRNAVYRSIAWVGSGLMKPGMHMLSPQQGLVPSEMRLRMNVNKPYFIYAQPFANYTPAIEPHRNGGLPLYTFNTGENQTLTQVHDVAVSGLDLISVVPNPYYAFSGYETGRLDNRVKFINLPKQCTISIYTVSGTLVRKYRKDNDLTYLDWDLKNTYNVPIAGGTYICHIEAPGLGEKVIKWFGVARPVDLQNF